MLKLPSRAVTVWATKSSFVHSIVSPTCAEIFGSPKLMSWIERCWVSAAAGAARIAPTAASAVHRDVDSGDTVLFQRSGHCFGMLFVTLENLQAGLQQALQL